jgi:hypothetical protein
VTLRTPITEGLGNRSSMDIKVMRPGRAAIWSLPFGR